MNGALFVSLGGLLSCVAIVDSAELAPPLVDVNGTPATVVDSKIVVVPSSSFADDSEDGEEDEDTRPTVSVAHDRGLSTLGKTSSDC